MATSDPVLELREQVALVQTRITGITSKQTYAVEPDRALPHGDLPIFVNFLQSATYNWVVLGADADVEVRRIAMRLFVIPRGQSGYPLDGPNRVSQWIAPVVSAFSARPTLERLHNIRRALIVSDSAPKQLMYANEAFLGIEFVLEVTRTLLRPYAKGE